MFTVDGAGRSWSADDDRLIATLDAGLRLKEQIVFSPDGRFLLDVDPVHLGALHASLDDGLPSYLHLPEPTEAWESSPEDWDWLQCHADRLMVSGDVSGSPSTVFDRLTAMGVDGLHAALRVRLLRDCARLACEFPLAYGLAVLQSRPKEFRMIDGMCPVHADSLWGWESVCAAPVFGARSNPLLGVAIGRAVRDGMVGFEHVQVGGRVVHVPMDVWLLADSMGVLVPFD